MKQMLDQNNGSGANAMIQQMMRRPETNIVSNTNEESVDQLLEKLAKKGKKVKIINDDDMDSP